MSCSTWPLLQNEKAARDTHSLGELRTHWRETVLAVALSICSIWCDIVIIAHAESPVKIRVNACQVLQGGVGMGSLQFCKMVHVFSRRVHIHLQQCTELPFLVPITSLSGSPCLPDHLPILPAAHLHSGLGISSGDGTESTGPDLCKNECLF